MISFKSIRISKWFSITLISLLMISVFAKSLTTPVKAPEDIILWIVTTEDPYPGYYGGYHDIVALLQTEFAKIGITLKWAQYDSYNWYDVVWDDTWNMTGDVDGDPDTHTYKTDGWDLAIFEWWLNPTSYIWLDELAYGFATPPEGWNIMSWNNTKADIFFKNAMTTLDTATHNQWLRKWQQEVMHDPPVIPIYYAEQMTAGASYLDNWDDTAWLYELSQLDINETKFNEVAPAARKAVGSNKVIWAATEPIYAFFPMGTLYYTEETVNVLKQGMLYRTSRQNLAFPSSGEFTVEPTLAADFPTWYQKPDGRWVARVPIRQGITWTDGVEFNATDVAFTYTVNLDPGVKSESYGDYSFLLDSVDVVDRYTVDFVYKDGMGPDYDFAGYQAHGWALGMLPWHQLKDENLKQWKNAPYNTDPFPDSADGIIGGGPNVGLECLGPYVPISVTGTIPYITAMEFQKRPNYVDTLGWSPNMPEYFIMKIIPDSATRFLALQNLEADFIEYPTAHVTAWESMESWPTHRVNSYFYPAAHTLWIQQRNTHLANRYVRLALAHAIPYQTIFNGILPGWGVVNAMQGKTYVMPVHDSFNDALGNYEYNITKAQQYMDLYWASIGAPADAPYAPLGDHDYSGFSEMIDYPVWASTYYNYTYQLPWYPSKPVDPDNDNSGQVLVADINLWGLNFGKRYPFPEYWIP